MLTCLSVSLVVSLALVVILLAARVVEVMSGKEPTHALNLAFQAAVAGLLSLLTLAARVGR